MRDSVVPGDGKLESLRYPIGRLVEDSQPTPEKHARWIGRIEALPGELRTLVHDLSGRRLDTPHRPGGWTIRALKHVTGCDMVYLVTMCSGALSRMVADFVAHFEAGLPEPWTIPADETGYMDGLLAGIVAFTIDVQRIEATWKLNQNHSAERRLRVIAALRESGKPNETEIADLMRRKL